MHYAPESSREYLPDAADTLSRDLAARSFHYRSAPIYLLTAIVGALLLAEVALSVVGTSTIEPAVGRIADPSSRPAAADAWSMLFAARTVFCFRLALLAAVLGGARILYQTLD